MSWTTKVIGRKQTIVGPVGDKLCIHVVALFDPAVDFTGHTWLLQIREHVMSSAYIDVPLVSDDCTVDTIDLLFELDNTSVLTGGQCYRWGVMAVAGVNAPYTLVDGVEEGFLRPYNPTAKPSP